MDAASSLTQAIGERVRRERQARRWTLDQLAETADVSRRMLVNVEQGTTNPSIGILLKIGDALGVGLPVLVEPPAPPSPVRVVRHGDGPVLWSGATGRAVLVAATAPPDVVELWDWSLGPDERYASEAHTAGTRELLHVQHGAVALEVADEVVRLEAGDAAAFPGDQPHAYVHADGDPARFSLAVSAPSFGTRPPVGGSHA